MNKITMILLVTSYFSGSIPFGWLISRWVKGIDIREHGSKNIGATNVFRVVGKKWGILVFVLDACKGTVAVLAPSLLGISLSIPWMIALGVTAILGHTFTLWLGFKGGKGVATSFGVFLAICPIPTLLAFAIFAFVFGIGRILSLGSLAAALSFPIMITLRYRSHEDYPWLLGISLFLALFIFYTHRKNIQRLVQGEEKKLF